MEFVALIQTPTRLDKLLAEHKQISRTAAAKLIKLGLVFVNNVAITKNNYLVQCNDLIVCKEEQNQTKKEPKIIKPFALELDIIYEDEAILIINKPSGLLVHPSIYNEQDTLVNALEHYYIGSYFILLTV